MTTRHQNILLVIILVVGLFLWTFLKTMKNGGIKITPADAKNRLDTEKGIVLLDVRNKDEYLKKHIPNSKLIPLGALSAEAEKSLPDKNVDIFVYCASGSRSSMAAKILTKMGYTKVYNMGGIFSWSYETVSGNK